MFQKKTTIIIGAGASKEVNLPVGYELKNITAKMLDIRFKHGYTQESGSYEICDALRKVVKNCDPPSNNINPYLEAAWTIRDGMPQAISIDNYIDAHQGNEKVEICGKLAIAASILDAERNSKIYINNSNRYNKIDFASVEKTWLNSFMQLLTENCRVHELEERLSHISLIIFNYDRCAEHYIYHALQNYYKIDKAHAKELVSKIRVFHPYGSVGNLPWMSQDGVEFGAELNTNLLVSIVGKIKTFTEGTDPDSSEILDIRRTVASSNILLFLGFAYHRQNLKLIKPDKNCLDEMTTSKCFGTSLGISRSGALAISNELSEFANLNVDDIHLKETTCSDLFYEYWRHLSLD